MKWVLIIDPSKNEREYLQRIVGRLGYRLFAAENGRQGLYYARQSLPDAVIIGEGVMDYTPTELCRIFKEDPSLSTAPILHVSSSGDRTCRTEAFEAGFAGVVQRPLSVRHFFQDLERCLSSTRKDIRVPVSIPVRILRGLEQFSLWSFNIGEGGVYLKTMSPLPPQTGLGVQFKLPGLRKLFDFKGRVIHSIKSDSEELPAGMGVMFTDISETIRTILSLYMEYHLTSAELPAR
ncbi:MAG: PilZ domain-containing protein [bacterium]|nr:PilZ domain-containing protein [bacterium]MDT8395600.1 PilZ domain-containing protein [bacterium]